MEGLREWHRRGLVGIGLWGMEGTGWWRERGCGGMEGMGIEKEWRERDGGDRGNGAMKRKGLPEHLGEWNKRGMAGMG